MFIVGLFKWWYTLGWMQRARLIMERLDRTMDYFSIGLLVKTMFSLFRQDGAGRVNGSLGDKVQAFFGRLISRGIGAIIRSAVLVVGLFVITFQALTGLAILILWLVVPFLPIAGFVMMLTGWVPEWR